MERGSSSEHHYCLPMVWVECVCLHPLLPEFPMKTKPRIQYYIHYIVGTMVISYTEITQTALGESDILHRYHSVYYKEIHLLHRDDSQCWLSYT